MSWKIFIVILTQPRVSWEDGRIASIRLTCRHVWGIFSIASCYRRAHPTMGGTNPRQVVLGCISKVRAEDQEQDNRQCFPVVSASVLWPGSVSQISSFSLLCCFWSVFYHNIRWKLEHHMKEKDRMWQHTPMIPTLGRQRQEDHQSLLAYLSS